MYTRRHVRVRACVCVCVCGDEGSDFNIEIYFMVKNNLKVS